MATNTGKVQKKRKEVHKERQDTTHVYRPTGLNYSTGDSTLKKHAGVDRGTLTGNRKERRGRKKADAPRGRRKYRTRSSKSKVRARRSMRRRNK